MFLVAFLSEPKYKLLKLKYLGIWNTYLYFLSQITIPTDYDFGTMLIGL